MLTQAGAWCCNCHGSCGWPIQLLHVVATLRAACRLSRLLDGGQQQRDQNRDDRDDHQQFNQCEAPGTHSVSRHRPTLLDEKKPGKTTRNQAPCDRHTLSTNQSTTGGGLLPLPFAPPRPTPTRNRTCCSLPRLHDPDPSSPGTSRGSRGTAILGGGGERDTVGTGFASLHTRHVDQLVRAVLFGGGDRGSPLLRLKDDDHTGKRLAVDRDFPGNTTERGLTTPSATQGRNHDETGQRQAGAADTSRNGGRNDTP